MPTINVYYRKTNHLHSMNVIVPKMKTYFAEKLSCGAIKLTTDEISIRFILANGKGMIGDVELEISAHAFLEKIKNQDKICLDTVDFMKKRIFFHI